MRTRSSRLPERAATSERWAKSIFLTNFRKNFRDCGVGGMREAQKIERFVYVEMKRNNYNKNTLDTDTAFITDQASAKEKSLVARN